MIRGSPPALPRRLRRPCVGSVTFARGVYDTPDTMFSESTAHTTCRSATQTPHRYNLALLQLRLLLDSAVHAAFNLNA